MYVFFWVFPRHPIVVCRRFGTLYQFHLQGLDVKYEVCNLCVFSDGYIIIVHSNIFGILQAAIPL